jgi:hypothetical protein
MSKEIQHNTESPTNLGKVMTKSDGYGFSAFVKK